MADISSLSRLAILILVSISGFGCGGDCTYDTLTGQWVVTAINATPTDTACCEGEHRVTFVFVEDGGSVDNPAWTYQNCVESDRLTAEDVEVGTSYSDTVERIDEGTCAPIMSEGFPSALEESESVCFD